MERSGLVEEFLRSGFWNSLPAFIQKAVIDFQPLQKQKPQEIPEPDGWLEHVKKSNVGYSHLHPEVKKWMLEGWKSIPERHQNGIIDEMGQKK